MSDWRALKAARERRELKRERDRSRLLRADAQSWRWQAEIAVHAPLSRLSQAAFDYLARRSANAIGKVQDEHTRRVVENAQSAVRERIEIDATADDFSRMTVLHFRLPSIDYHFAADLGRLTD